MQRDQHSVRVGRHSATEDLGTYASSTSALAPAPAQLGPAAFEVDTSRPLRGLPTFFALAKSVIESVFLAFLTLDDCDQARIS